MLRALTPEGTTSLSCELSGTCFSLVSWSPHICYISVYAPHQSRKGFVAAQNQLCRADRQWIPQAFLRLLWGQLWVLGRIPAGKPGNEQPHE